MKAEPQKEHHWLQKLVGEWTYESEAVMAPGQPPVKGRDVSGRAGQAEKGFRGPWARTRQGRRGAPGERRYSQ